jgi:TetR/AcrR family transcriptional repressor of nem operon
MRYDKGHKAATRQKILETASCEFRKEGIEGIGLADIMGRAGLTHGGFYSHFSSKDELVRQTLSETYDPMKPTIFRQEGQSRDVEEVIRGYLSVRHRDHPEKGCYAAALAGEIGRQPRGTREAFTDLLNKRIADLENGLSPKLSAKAKRGKALAIFSTIMGALQLSRTVPDSETSEEILEAGIQAALGIARS